MDILTVHQIPTLNNARRRWLRSLAPGDRVFFCTYTDYVDAVGLGTGEFEEGFVLARDAQIIVQFDDQTTVRIAATGQWVDDEGDEASDSAWIIPAEGTAARQLRRILAAAQSIAPDDERHRAHTISQLRRMISGINGAGTVERAERLLTYAALIQSDLRSLAGTVYLDENGIDPLKR